MTRPMPYTEAPPHPGRSPKFSGDDVGHEERLAAREAWDDARWKYTESIVVGRDKRLTDAECAAEYWMWATASERVRAFIAISRKPGESVTANLDFQRAFHEQVTWHRFATHPHALEVQE